MKESNQMITANTDDSISSHRSEKDCKDYYKSMITDALKRHGAITIFEDENKSLDIIATIIYRKYYKNSGKEFEEPQTTGQNPIWKILKVLLAIIAISSFLGFDLSSITDESGVKTKTAKFPFKTGNDLASRKFFGKDEIFEEWIKISMKCIEAIYGGATKEELEEDSIYTKLNYVLFGPPGTGKTLFIHSFVRRLDTELKKKYLEEIKNPEYLELCNKHNKAKIEEFLKKQESRVFYFDPLPGDINGMHVGESEKNIKFLFKEARECIIGQRWMISVIFFDEGDVFFSKRSSSGDPGSMSATNVKSELLTKIGVISSEDYLPLFVFTATNRMEEFDDAFKRRFNHHCNFNNLAFTERFDFIKFILNDFPMNDDEIGLIAYYTADKSQAFIVEKMKEYIETNHSTHKKAFYYKKYINFLRENAYNTNMI